MKRMLYILLFTAASICTHSQEVVAGASNTTSNALAPTAFAPNIITIPVVVHILFNTARQNISDAQVISQIEALNKDYRQRNEDGKNIPAYFAALAGDAGLEFRLANIDPSGYTTNGIVRKHTDIKLFGTDDRIKSSINGGDNPWDKNKYLNIWVGNLAGGILGYTSTIGGPAEKDGVVIQYTAFGTVGTVAAPFNLGRTATHEVGHWLNLKHIWGDAYCGDDEVNDTPKQRASNRGRPSGEKFTCEIGGHGDMYMNFMDLTDDAGMFLFTQGQCNRMRALFSNGGQRHEMLFSNAIAGTGIARSVESTAGNTISTFISAYPNPAQATITVSLTSFGNETASTLVIYNFAGQAVLTQTMTGTRTSINISQLSRGMYFIKILNRDRGVMTKFVKN